MNNWPTPPYGLPKRLGEATFFQNIRLRLAYISFGVLIVHLALLAWLQAGQPEARRLVVLEPLQTRQILAPHAITPPPTNITKNQPQQPEKPDQLARPARRLVPSVAAPSVAVVTARPETTALAVPPTEDVAVTVGPEKSQAVSATSSETAVTAQRGSPKAVTLPSSMADYLSNPPPNYPVLSLRLNEQGKVVVRVLIGKNGRALDARITQSSGFDRLDQAALRAVLSWRYVPGTVDGQAQDMWFDAPINFRPPH